MRKNEPIQTSNKLRKHHFLNSLKSIKIPEIFYQSYF